MTNIIAIVMALCTIESSNMADAVGDGGQAVGILQICPVMVSEANRLHGSDRWTIEDRWSEMQSKQMAHLILSKRATTLSKACEVWNPQAGEWYFKRVESELKRQKEIGYE